MRIIEFSFRNNVYPTLEIKPLKLGNVNLLVGPSGVGKSWILNTIYGLSAIITNTNITGFAYWSIKFKINEKLYTYQLNLNSLYKYKYIEEILSIDNKTILNRDKSVFKFMGKETLKLSPTETALYLLREEPIIQPVFNAFLNNIVLKKLGSYSYDKTEERGPKLLPIKLSEKPTKEKIRRISPNIDWRLYLLEKYHNEIFNQIKSAFIDIFPFVISLGTKDFRSFPFYAELAATVPFQPLAFITEHNIEGEIPSEHFSSGMYRVLVHLIDLFTLPDGSVYMIDEIENSLGVASLPIMISQILEHSSRLQLILTSHHPYIINNIKLDYWRLISRNGNIITIKNASDIPELQSISRQQAFVKLINSEVYSDGIK